MGVIKDKLYGILSTDKNVHKPGVCCKPGVSWELKAKAGAIMGGAITLVGVVRPTPRFRLGGMLVCKDNQY